MSWQFNPMNPSDLNVDPIEHEFFATEALGGITDALVREAIQNSLDAAEEANVGVRFYLGRTDAVTSGRYLDGLWPHAEASHHGNAILPGRGDQLRFLAVEDKGTRGLQGDTSQYEDDAGNRVRNDFYYFWRNIGRSRKERTERGRWGLGKTVFAAASRLNAFFGLTVRRADSHPLLMGQAVLRIHRLGGFRYRPYGYYGRHEDGFTMPIDDPGSGEMFAQSFGLQRSGSGLSIVIPFPDEEITAEGLLESVLRHYFHPLVEGKLEVEIVEKDGASFCLRENDLEHEIRRKNQLRHLLPLIELARWGQDPEEEAVAVLNAPDAGHVPKLTEDLFNAADVVRLRRRFDECRRLALHVRLPIEPVGAAPRETEFRLLVERDAKDQSGEGYFVRQGITIENSKARRPRGVRWIVVVSDPTLSAFLGDAENPAHTEWQRSSPKFKAKYRLGPSTLDFLRSFPSNAASLLSRPAERRDPDLLRDIFSLAGDAVISSQNLTEPSPKGSEVKTADELIPGKLGKNGTLSLGRVRTGFRLNGKVDEDAPRRLEVLAAYDVLRGNPFQRYSPLDFRMNESIAVQPRGARIVVRRENRLEIEIEAPEFDVLVTRFDENRDLRVKVRPLEESS